jgi:hypothetical protein
MLVLSKPHLNLTKALLPTMAFMLTLFPTGVQAQGTDQRQIEDNLAAASGGVPSILLQYASVVSAAYTITITRAPVTTSTGAVIYEDITLQFAVGATGQITFASSEPTVVPSPNLLVAGFEAGTYVNAAVGENMGFVLAGPGIGAGVSVWSITLAATYWYATTPGNATFWVGPIANSPIAARLTAAKITSNDWSYGVLGTQEAYAAPYWSVGDLLGFSQVGNTVTVARFTNNLKVDVNLPVDQFTYTLK